MRLGDSGILSPQLREGRASPGVVYERGHGDHAVDGQAEFALEAFAQRALHQKRRAGLQSGREIHESHLRGR